MGQREALALHDFSVLSWNKRPYTRRITVVLSVSTRPRVEVRRSQCSNKTPVPDFCNRVTDLGYMETNPKLSKSHGHT